MSDTRNKEKHSKRIHGDEVAVKRQVRIAKQHGLKETDRDVKQPHRMAKRHAMDCGNPECFLCGNPRKTMKELTMQEKSFYQDKLHEPESDMSDE